MQTMRKHIAGLTEGCPVAFKAVDIETGAQLGTAPSALPDRFVLQVPLAGRTIRWNVVYDHREPDRAPDLIFSESDDPDASDPCSHFADLGKLPSLTSWDASDGRALQRVALEAFALLRGRHRDAAIALVPERARAEFALIASSDGAELFVERPADGSPLRIHASLPLHLESMSPSEPGQLLLAFTPSRPEVAADARAVLPARVLSTIGKAPKLPAFFIDGSIVDFTSRITDAIKAPASAVTTRQKMFQALRKILGNPLEFDPPLCTSIWFAFEDKEAVPTLLHVTVPDTFPTEPPGIMLQSGVYHKLGRPYQLTYKGIPHSPRWTPEEIASRIASFARDNVRDFNVQCAGLS